jgi:hypothetical protein
MSGLSRKCSIGWQS